MAPGSKLPDFEFQQTLHLQTQHISKITGIAWSPNGQILTCSFDDGCIRLWNLETKKLCQTLHNHSNAVYGLAWSPDGEILVSGSYDGNINLWQPSIGQLLRTINVSDSRVFSVAWSPDGLHLASCSNEDIIRLWNPNTGALEQMLKGHTSQVNNVAWCPNGQILASCSDDGSIKLWESKTGKQIRTLLGHSGFVNCVAWSPDGLMLASGAADRTIRLWDLKTGEMTNIFEGHIDAINHVAFFTDSRLLFSKSVDATIRVWDCITNAEVTELSVPSDSNQYHWPANFALHPNQNQPTIATSGENDSVVNIYKFRGGFTPREIKKILENAIRQSQTNKEIFLINTKVVLVGESGVGKSALGIHIAEKKFRKTDSTHGAQFWQIPVTQTVNSGSDLIKVRPEITLWDLAGQPDYHLVHQLFLDNTDVALLLFDCSDAAEPFRGIPYWAKVLKKLAPANALKYLVSARCDVSPVTVDQREINRIIGNYSLDGYFRTSAKTGEGVEQLLQKILASIPWHKLPRTTTPKLFQVIREFLLERKEAGDTLIPIERVKQEVEKRYTERPPTQAELDTVVGLLQAQGFVYCLAPTPTMQLVLLRPEFINQYASSIIQAARNHPEGIGSIPERDVVCANLPFNSFAIKERLPIIEEKLVLESTVELFIRCNLAFRELGRLVFPSQFNTLRRFAENTHPPTEVTYEFSGSIEAIYASLVVCLSYTKDFQRENLWKYTAEFSREAHRLGFAMEQVSEGTGELEIYFYPGVSDFYRVTFIQFITNHLYTKGIDIQERIRLYCPNPECGKEVTNREAIEARLKAGKLEISCQYCDTGVLIPRSIEEKYESDKAYIKKQQELQATVKERTKQEVKAFRQDNELYMTDVDKHIRILHLSDIHLGTGTQVQQYFTQLASDLTQNLNVKQLNYLVISGDVANRSTEEEYEAAFELIDKLVKRYGLDPNRVVIVPGNHDLNWELSETAYGFVPTRKLPKPLPEGRYIEAGSAGALICDQTEYKKRFDYFNNHFYKKIYNKSYPQEYDQQAILHPCPEDKILFLALNSCWEIDHEYKNRAGIHPNAIANALDKILNQDYSDWLKIAVWHHPVNGFESIKNVAFLEQLAVNGFQLGIHGHIHEAKDENFQYDTRRGLRIIAAGTFGAPTKEQVTGIPLQYNLLTLDPESGILTVETRKKEKTDGAWSADARWGDKNNPVPRYTIGLKYGNSSSQSKTSVQDNRPNPGQSIFGGNTQVGGNISVGSITQIYGTGTASQLTNLTNNPTPKCTILLLASSPADTARLRLDKQARARIHDDTKSLHGTMPLWGIDHWVPLGDLFVDVNILESLSSSRRSELDDLWQDFTTGDSNYRSLDRIGLGRQQQRVSGLAVLERNTNLMVVGKPGSGKTTYLQRIVTECNAGKLQTHRIPVLIKLRDFVDDRHQFAYNLELFLGQLWKLSNTNIRLLLNQGKALVLLDGLDEVTGEAGKLIAREIKGFARAYPQVQVIVTCRTQNQESRFERFDYAEVADFNEEQVRVFAAHWFGTVCVNASEGEIKTQEFLGQLFREENKPIRELAITPILLSLTCAVFHQTQKFYSKRSKLYEEGLELLVERWDKSRSVERGEIYQDLSVERKLELLSFLAVKKFEQEKYVLFEQEELERYIGEFLGIKLQESRGVMRAIEFQHGLLIERAQKVWSFSHLTFQEYLVAKWFCEQTDWQSLTSHVMEKYWREVFLLVVLIINNADNLLQLMQENINKIVSSDEKLQRFLNWLNEKFSSCQTSKSPIEVRFFYFNLGLGIELDIINLELFFNFDIYASTLEIEFYKLVLEQSIERTLQSGKNYSAFEWNLPEPSSDYIRSLNPEMLQSLQQISTQLPKPPDDEKDTMKNQQWWQVYKQMRIEKTRYVMVKYRNIGHEWQFTNKQKQLLKQYYDANKLLIDCLNSGCVVSKAVRQEIEDTLLLPIKEIEKYKSTKFNL